MSEDTPCTWPGGDCPLAAEIKREARAKALEEAAAWIDCGCTIRDAVVEKLEDDGERRAAWICPHGDCCGAVLAAAIRALAQHGEPPAPASDQSP